MSNKNITLTEQTVTAPFSNSSQMGVQTLYLCISHKCVHLKQSKIGFLWQALLDIEGIRFPVTCRAQCKSLLRLVL